MVPKFMNVKKKEIKLKFLLAAFLFIAYILSFFVNCYIHATGQEEFDVLLKLVNDQFSKSVKKRMRVEKLAVIRFWTAKGKFTVKVSG